MVDAFGGLHKALNVVGHQIHCVSNSDTRQGVSLRNQARGGWEFKKAWREVEKCKTLHIPAHSEGFSVKQAAGGRNEAVSQLPSCQIGQMQSEYVAGRSAKLSWMRPGKGVCWWLIIVVGTHESRAMANASPYKWASFELPSALFFFFRGLEREEMDMDVNGVPRVCQLA